MGKVWIVAVREFIETVKTRAFLFSTVLMPLVIIALVGATQWIAKKAEQESLPPRAIRVLDGSGQLAEDLEREFAEYNQRNPQKPFEYARAADSSTGELAAQVQGGELYAYIQIPADVLTGNVAVEIGRKDTQLAAGRQLQEIVNDAVHAVRFRQAGIDARLVRLAMTPVAFTAIDTSTRREAGGDDFSRLMMPFMFMFLLYMGTFGISMGLLTSVLEEKSSRIVEVLLSSISPMQLMAGKILGMVVVGLVLLGVWSSVGYWAAESRGMGNLVSTYSLTLALIYFIPGFLLFSAMLAAIGAACNTLKEAQSMMSPLTIVNIVPLMLWWYLSQHPNSPLSVALSFVPPITPFVMILRICADPGLALWQIVASLIVLWLAAIGMIWAAAKVFRVGVLMYGKTPTLRELIRWTRYA